MVGLVRVSRWSYAVTVGLVMMCAAWGNNVFAQDTVAADPSTSPRERELRDQLKTILRCPADSFEGRKPHIGIEPGQGPYLYSYGMNGSLALNVGDRSVRTKPARKIMLTEMRELYTDAGWWSPGAPLAWRHGRPFALELTGLAGGRWSQGEDSDDAKPLTMDALAFCRVLSGRAEGAGLLATQVPF